MRYIKHLIVLITICLISMSALASYTPFFSLEELSEKCNFILQGTIVSVNPRVHAEGIDLPFTIITMKVTNSHKGNVSVNKEIEIIQPGGYLSENKYVSAVDSPIYTIGEELILFLNKKYTGWFGEKYITNASSQSKFNVKDGKVFRKKYSSIAIHKGGQKRNVSKENPIFLNEFLNNLNSFSKQK